MRIGIVIGSTRPGRVGAGVGQWVHAVATSLGPAEHDGEAVEYELVDLETFDLDLLNEPTKPSVAGREYENAKTRVWSEKIDSIDGFVFVTPEYNHGVPAAMKNALDVLYPEWNHKGLSLVGYGADGGVRAIEHWRTIAANVHLHPTREQVSLSIFTEFGDDGFTPGERRSGELVALLNSLVRLTAATRALRS
ncbi:NADPH-dependent FMN reductase [Janibacter massiliensis]|uniref:NADPH-dependent FMN reductase n=1 Tax=Janibacter massiliensis TaxID=2058291 RepID=UPI000D1135AC|nr:NAD(P)H-dependent oxidoreductase [Janibacter massiliensis]